MASDKFNPQYEKELRSAADWHISYVYNDPEFNQVLMVIREMERRAKFVPNRRTDRAKQRLAERYGIEVEDVNIALLPLYLENRKRKTTLTYDGDKEEWTIRLHSGTTEAELLETFTEFKQQRALQGIKPRVTRRKPPQNTQLLYSIFKARKRGDTFPKIYEQYYAGQLPGYNGANNRFNGGESIETYYNKYYKQDRPIT